MSLQLSNVREVDIQYMRARVSNLCFKGGYSYSNFFIKYVFPLQTSSETNWQIVLLLWGFVKKYPHWCFNVLWVCGTAFCAHML